LAFHGFGQTKKNFEQFAHALREQYTVYSFDLFYHGLSFWHEKEEPLQKQFWKDLVNHFLNQHEIERFSLAGYSLGGKFALAILEAFPARIERLILIAPDGIKQNFWYKLATYPSWTRKIFRSMIVRPQYFYNLVNIFSNLGLLDKGTLKFAKYQMNTRRKRRQVYYAWVVFRLFKFNMKKIADIINRQSIQVEIFIGKYDKMITRTHMKKLTNKLHNYKLLVLETGHNNLINEVTDFI
jgi:pimeloyl-ACP methyl ester carboxylesterase